MPPISRRVLVVLHEETLGGASISVLRCVPELERRGWEFAFFAPRPSATFDRLRELGYAVGGAPRTVAYSLRALRLPPGPRTRLAAIPRQLRDLVRTIRAYRPAVVHANSMTTIADVLVARLAGVPAVLHVHEIVGVGLKASLFRRAASSLASEVVAVSSAGADHLTHGTFRPRVVYGGAPSLDEAVAIRDRSPVVVGTIGVVSRRKGTDLFVEAARLVKAQRTDIEFTLVGAASEPLDAEWASGVLARAEAVGVSHVDHADVPAVLGEWDVFALPSRKDPFPVAMLEAMGAGLPVVGAAVDGIPEQIGDAGVVVAAEDPAALARSIIELADAPVAERARLGAAARARVRTEFTIERQAAGLEQAYLAAISGGGGG